MTEQEAFDEWCPEPYRRRIWTHQSQEAARAAFAAAWYVQEKLKSTLSPADRGGK